MKITVRPGNNLYGLTSITPSAFVASFGRSAVDSPTQVDSQYCLPYIPNSALKGVLGGALGAGAEKQKKKEYFGTSDEDENQERAGKSAESQTLWQRFGKAGKLVFGNAELLVFPCRFLGAESVNVVVAQNLLALLRYASKATLSENARGSISKMMQTEYGILPCGGKIDAFDFQKLSPLTCSGKEAAIGEIKLLIEKIAGADALFDLPMVLANFESSMHLWKKSSELRTLTKINDRNTAEDNNLRTIEMIPPGSVFVALISNLGQSGFAMELNGGLQLGAWENIGFGWFGMGQIDCDGEKKEDESVGSDVSWSFADIDVARIMTDAYSAIFKLKDRGKAGEKIKPAISQFGFRLKAFGAEAALAFELAKAKPLKKKFGYETYAHRWLLARLLLLEGPPFGRDGQYPPLEKYRGQYWFDRPLSDLEKMEIELRWLWLRKFSELGMEVKREE